MTNGRCLIWPDCRADLHGDERKALWWVDSSRAGGRYGITEAAANLLEQVRVLSEDAAKARLTTRLIDHRQETGRPLVITLEWLETDAQDVLAASLSVPDRVQRLMKQLARWSPAIGQAITLFRHSSYSIGLPLMLEIGQSALAWSESTTAEELKFLCRYLADKNWIRIATRPTDPNYSVEVTVQGYAALDSPPDSESNEAFVAMWLDESMDAAYDQGIRPGIEGAGYKAVRIDREKNVDKIDDAIMAGIRRCRFVLADFTHGKGGARGSVYFEAGFARGLGIEVFSTCRKDCINKLHFDTRQYHHTTWERDKLDDLRRRIADRIGARVGPASSSRRRQPGS